MPCSDLAIELRGEGIEFVLLKSETRGHRMPPKSHDEIRVARRDRFEHIAHMDTGNRTGRAAQSAIAGARKRNNGSPHALFHTTGHQTHDALMPLGIEETHAATVIARLAQSTNSRHRLLLHGALDAATFAIELIEALRDQIGLLR